MSDVTPERLAELIWNVLPEPQAIGGRLATDIRAALRELQTLRAYKRDAERLQKIVNEQAVDEGLWFVAQTAPEAYLQQELRRLHGHIEGDARSNATATDALCAKSLEGE